MRMKITQYGYPNDPYMDSETKKGHGAYHDLVKDVSCALTDSAKHALGVTRGSWVMIKFHGGGHQVRRVDDRAPESDKRCDLYNPGGFEHGLEDYADVTLTSGPAIMHH
jgi:hypothetical protein